ncbi:MAG: plastocyanin/azurin family copper-binding protein, partial [Geminicoccaceae bacterium]
SRRPARLAAFRVLAMLACAQAPARAETYLVEVSNFAIEPPDLTIQAGDTVEWRIVSGRHSSTSKDEAWDSGELEQGAAFAQRFDVPGVYPYFCTPHDFMRGTITVLPAPSWWQRVKTWLATGW